MGSSILGMNILLVLALIFLVLGIIMFIIGKKITKKRAEMMVRRTEQTEGTLDRVDRRPLKDTEYVNYVPIYTYTVDFQIYTVEGVPNPNRESISEAPVNVFYDPAHPKDACIENDIMKKWGAIFSLFGIFLILVSIGMLFFNYMPF